MRVIGLAPGRSPQSLTAAVVDLWLHDGVMEAAPVSSRTSPYPVDLREELARVVPAPGAAPASWGRLDAAAGRALADAAVRALAGLAPPAQLVVAHGPPADADQATGGPPPRDTIALGDPAWVAEATGLPVVSALRSRDLAAGGRGFPLSSTLDVLWLRGRLGNAVGLDLGALSRVTGDVHTASPLVYDAGPGNALVDAAVARITQGRESFDGHGAAAARGHVDHSLLEHLLTDPHYAAPPPRPSARELFGAAYLERALHRRRPVRDDDLVATLTALTATTAADAALSHRPTVVVAAGGGTANPTLMRLLDQALGDVPLVTAARLGMPDEDKEAIACAVIGFLTWHGIPGNLPTTTGARHASVLGTITPGREPLALPPPAAPPTRLLLSGPR
jgi:anhydro-N-acetylmuramic acid kinase